MKKISLSHMINFIMFFYILSLYLFTYREGLNMISNILAFSLMGLIWMNFMILDKKIVFTKFLFVYLLFVVFALISSFYSISPETSIVKTRTLFLLFILMTSLVNYIDTRSKLYKIMRYFAYSGFITSSYIILSSDFSSTGRFGSEIGNVNEIGLIIGIASVFCLYFLIEWKEYIFIPILLINAAMIMLTGSRKSLIFLVLALIILMSSKIGKKLGSKLKAIGGGLIVLYLASYAIYNIPLFYRIIGTRMNNLLDFAFGEGTVEGSMNVRSYMIQLGYQWFKERPMMGFGIDGYKFLYGEYTGLYTYSHNNIIELLVDIGLLGTIIFLVTHILIVIDLIKSMKKVSKPLVYSFLAIIIGYVIMSVGLVYYDSKHISIILAIGSIVPRIGKIRIRKSESSERNNSEKHKAPVSPEEMKALI